MRLRKGHNQLDTNTFRRMKLAPSPACHYGLADHTTCAQMTTSADSKTKCVANSSPATHQTLWQQERTGEDSHIHLVDWTLSVAVIEKKICAKDMCLPAESVNSYLIKSYLLLNTHICLMRE